MKNALRSALILFTFVLSAPVRAACVNPASPTGGFRYNSTLNIYQSCDGFAWTSMSSGNVGASCTVAGLIDSSSGTPRFCNGTNMIAMDGAETSSACTLTGSYKYTATRGYMEWCDGSTYRSMRPPSSGIAYVQQTVLNSATSATSFNTPVFSASVTAGNTIVCSINFNGTSTTVSGVTLGASQALTNPATAYTLTGTTERGQIWYLPKVTTGGSLNIRVTLSAASSFATILCNEYSGLNADNTLDTIALTNGTGTTVTAAAYTNDTAKELYVSTGAFSDATPTADPNFTLRGSALNRRIIQDRIVTTRASSTPTLNGGTASSNGQLQYMTLRGQ